MPWPPSPPSELLRGHLWLNPHTPFVWVRSQGQRQGTRPRVDLEENRGHFPTQGMGNSSPEQSVSPVSLTEAGGTGQRQGQVHRAPLKVRVTSLLQAPWLCLLALHRENWISQTHTVKLTLMRGFGDTHGRPR